MSLIKRANIILVISILLSGCFRDFGIDNNSLYETDISVSKVKWQEITPDVKNQPRTSQVDQSNVSPEVLSKDLESCAEGEECEEGYFCYDSQYMGMGPNGLTTGPQEGDLLCHRRCEKDTDCEEGECQETEIIGGDIVTSVRFCSDR